MNLIRVFLLYKMEMVRFLALMLRIAYLKSKLRDLLCNMQAVVSRLQDEKRKSLDSVANPFRGAIKGFRLNHRCIRVAPHGCLDV